VTTFKATVLTLFPDSIRSIVDASILGRAQKAGILAVEGVDVRAYAEDKHRTVDDSPCGGGPGMILRVDVVHRALQDVVARDGGARRRVVLLDAAGATFRQADARRLATYEHLVLVCGRYEGVDARVAAYVDESISIGDYVLTGGELAALVVLDATARQLPGVLGNEASRGDESHERGLLEHRQYTRPITYDGRSVPPVLMSGNHRDVERARRKDALVRTAALRPDLYARVDRAKADEKLLADDDVPTLEPTS
jgi:tRNA (guanine37-N1)-methyltransferase